jgi:membrane-associated protease RseP (regulator of RpoE activity)
MDLLITGFVIALIIYTIIAVLVWKFKIFGNSVQMYGPFMGIQTDKVKFFDRFKDVPFLRAYTNISTILIFLFGLFMSALIILVLKITFDVNPEPTGIYAPRNVFMIPGINEFIPVTLGVFIAFVFAGAIHEFGHAIVCRAEGINIVNTGILLAIIPIGAFVNPREDEIAAASIGSRLRVYSAGVANNFVVGLIAFFVVCLAISTMVVPIIAGSVYVFGTGGDNGGVSPGMYVTSLNGVPVTSSQQFNTLLQASPNTNAMITAGYNKDSMQSYTFNNKAGNFFDVVDRGNMPATMGTMMTLQGMLKLLILPFDTSVSGMELKQVMMNTQDASIYSTPFMGFWEIIHMLYWFLFINISIALFNAIPMVPLDGGYIFKDVMNRIFGKTRIKNHISTLAYGVSGIMFIAILGSIILPYILHFL